MRTPAEEIATFIMDHYERAKTWHYRSVVPWVAWNIENRFCITARCEGSNEILGLLIVRPVMKPELAVSNKEFDVEGDTYYVDLAIILKPKRQVMQLLGFALIERFGQRDKIAFQRQGVGPVLVSDAHMHRAKLLKEISYGRK